MADKKSKIQNFISVNKLLPGSIVFVLSTADGIDYIPSSIFCILSIVKDKDKEESWFNRCSMWGKKNALSGMKELAHKRGFKNIPRVNSARTFTGIHFQKDGTKICDYEIDDYDMIVWYKICAL